MATPVNGPLPEGTVTFLLTDVEGSTLAGGGPAAMAGAIARHYELSIGRAAHGGARPVEQGEGDSVVAVFAAGLRGGRGGRGRQQRWPQSPGRSRSSRVRMALHTGEARCATRATTRAGP